MYKPVIIFFLIFALIGCRGVSVKDTVDYLELEREIPATTSVIPTDSEITYDKTAVIAKAKTYVGSSYSHASSTHYDSHGLLLPTRDGVFIDEGDASGFNMLSLATMCMLRKSYIDGKLTDSTFNLSTDITQLWSDIKTSVITSEGTLIRHPNDLDGTSISKDHMTLFMSSLALIKHSSCTDLIADVPTVLKNFINYGIANDWEYGLAGRTAASTTYLIGRHQLYDLQAYYGLGYTEDDLDLSTSAEATTFNTSVADYINENKYYCNLGFAGSCLRIANAGTFGNNLTFQSIIIHRLSNTVYNTSKTSLFFEDMGKVGESIGFPNWLFLSGYRHFILGSEATYNDVNKHLDESWPDNLPTETTGVKDFGCTNYVWQRTIGEACNGSNTEYIGTDFLYIFAMTNL